MRWMIAYIAHRPYTYIQGPIQPFTKGGAKTGQCRRDTGSPGLHSIIIKFVSERGAKPYFGPPRPEFGSVGPPGSASAYIYGIY